jgi:hypothetical protein
MQASAAGTYPEVRRSPGGVRLPARSTPAATQAASPRETDMQTIKFESTCGNCRGRITSKDGGASWRHDHAPADKHHGHAIGVMTQI